jgi:4-hydroxybenzoate polyprenyltransferase
MVPDQAVPRSPSLISFSFTLSRFRFWIYTGGTYVVGYVLGMSGWEAFFRPEYYLYLLYFFFPANILIYGVNDYWDEATDRANPKKQGKEQLLSEGDRRRTLVLLGLTGVLSLALLLTQDLVARLVFLAFLFLAYFYSAPPLRFKQVPVLDFASNMLYIMPGIFGFYLASGTLPPGIFILAGFLHISAMHVYSAIPDIEFDRSAGITTTPVWIGRGPALLLCLAAWGGFCGIVLPLSGFNPLALPALLYPLFPALNLLRPEISVERLYWYLPYVNTALGGLLFAAVTVSKMPPSFPPFF